MYKDVALCSSWYSYPTHHLVQEAVAFLPPVQVNPAVPTITAAATIEEPGGVRVRAPNLQEGEPHVPQRLPNQRFLQQQPAFAPEAPAKQVVATIAAPAHVEDADGVPVLLPSQGPAGPDNLEENAENQTTSNDTARNVHAG